MKFYPASLDKTSKVLTGFVTVLFLGILIHNIWLFRNKVSDIPVVLMALIPVTLIGTYAFCYAFKITGYELSNRVLVIRRRASDKVIELMNVKRIEIPDKESMRWTIRTFGNGGLFGYWGKFTNKAYGNMTWYATRRSNYILLFMSDGKKIMITPDDLYLAKAIQNELGSS